MLPGMFIFSDNKVVKTEKENGYVLPEFTFIGRLKYKKKGCYV